jgi:hypothetical protein
MISDDKPVTPALKVKALRRIQLMLGQVRRIRGLDSGLTEEEFAALANEELVEVSFDADEGPILDRYYIDKILSKGFLILSDADLAQPSPLQVAVVHPHKSVGKRIFEGTRSGLWDLIKVAAGAVLGWWLKKHFP